MIALASDHGGYNLKTKIIKYLEEKGVAYKDFGCYNTESVDYPFFAAEASRAIVNGECRQGIFVCTTGLGIAMAANKMKGIRAAVCTNEYTAEMTRRHNNANVLCMGEQVVTDDMAVKITDIFLNTEFEGGKHERRVNLLSKIENGEL